MILLPQDEVVSAVGINASNRSWIDVMTFLENEEYSCRNRHISKLFVPFCTKLIISATICTSRYEKQSAR